MRRQPFSAFVHKVAKLGVQPAKSIVLYASSRTDPRSAIVARIISARDAGHIDADYAKTLIGYVDALHNAWERTEKLVDEREDGDRPRWEGEGMTAQQIETVAGVAAAVGASASAVASVRTALANDGMVTTGQACRALGVTTWTMRRLCRRLGVRREPRRGRGGSLVDLGELERRMRETPGTGPGGAGEG